MTARERRALVIGGALVLIGVAARLGVAGVRWTQVQLDAARQTASRAERARALVAESPARQALLRERAGQIVDLAPLLLGGATEAEAAAALAGELNALAARHRVAVSRVDPMPDSAAGRFTRIELRIQAESDLAGVYGFLHAVETAPLLLSMTEVALTAQDGAAPVERLRLDGTVRGWMLRRVSRSEAEP